MLIDEYLNLFLIKLKEWNILYDRNNFISYNNMQTKKV